MLIQNMIQTFIFVLIIYSLLLTKISNENNLNEHHLHQISMKSTNNVQRCVQPFVYNWFIYRSVQVIHVM